MSCRVSDGVAGASGPAPVDCRLVITRAPTRRFARLSVLSLASGVMLILAAAMPVFAHAELVRSDPDDGAVLASPPASITLTFSEGLDAGKSSIKLVGPDGDIARGTPAADGARVMRIKGLALAPGAYTVRWTAAAQDGHVERGTTTFSVTEPTPAPTRPAAPSANPTPTAQTSADAATPRPTAVAAPASAPGSSPAPSGDAPAGTSTGDVLVPIVAGLLVVGVVGALALRRSRRI
jgi:methionine-rich copper-binding protein CopC